MSVSVIIPTYNRAQLVQKTIDSVLRQTYKNYEIIVIDDGSTDDTEDQLKRYGDRIKYVKQENAGLNAARNRAMDIASGDYIALLDSDDLWLDFKLELETAILERYPDRSFVFSDFFILKPGNRRISNGLHTWYTESPDWSHVFDSADEWPLVMASEDLDKRSTRIYFGDIYYISLFGPRVLPSASLFRRSMVDTAFCFNEHNTACGDWEFFAKLSHKHGPVFVDMETAINRSHEDAVRLTRVDRRVQLRERLALINQTWREDKDFYAEYGDEVDKEQMRIYKQLFKYQLLEGEKSGVRSSLREMRQIAVKSSGHNILPYMMLTYTPGSRSFFRLFRSVKGLFAP